MDYLRIYNELIEHRKMMPKLEGVYYERHHINPRCMGGGDEDENLIHLTAEDHFMAHVLLAKAYGGKLWFAANAMKMLKGKRKIKHRRLYAIIRKNFSREMMSNTVYKFKVFSTGETYELTMSAARVKFNLSRSEISRVASGERREAHGVGLASTDNDYIHPANKKEFTLKRISDGALITGTRKYFKDVYNISGSQMSMLMYENQKQAAGFCLPAASVKELVRVSYEFRNIFTGEVVDKTMPEMCSLYGCHRSALSLVVNKKAFVTKGFCLNSTPLDDPRLLKYRRATWK